MIIAFQVSISCNVSFNLIKISFLIKKAKIFPSRAFVRNSIDENYRY